MFNIKKEKVDSFAWYVFASATVIFFVASLFTFTPFHFSHVNDAYAATTRTVCDSGCAFTSIDSALEVSEYGDIIQVTSTYTPISDSHTMATSSVTLECGPGVTIGTSTAMNTINVTASSSVTIQNCSFDRMRIYVGNAATDGVTISGNTFATTTASSSIVINNSSNDVVQNVTVSNNSGLNEVLFNNVGTSTISNNVFDIIDAASSVGSSIGSGINVLGSSFGLTTSTQNIDVLGNTVNVRVSNLATPVLFETTKDLVVTSNTLRTMVAPPGGGGYGMYFKDVQATVTQNLIDMTTSTLTNAHLMLLFLASTAEITSTIDIRHNTFVGSGSPVCGFLRDVSGQNFDYSATTTYNICYSESAVDAQFGFGFLVEGGGTITTSSDYNGFYNMYVPIWDGDEIAIATGANSLTSDPLFSNTTTYEGLAGFSTHLDVNGTLDIGHISQARTSTIYLDDDGVVDYSSVDGQSFSDVTSYLRNGDTVQFAAGTYSEQVVISNLSNVTVAGAGASTIIDGGDTRNYGVRFDTSPTGTVQNMLIQNVSVEDAAAVSISNSPGVNVTNVTTTANYGGVVITSGSNNNTTINSSTLQNSSFADVFALSGTHTINNTNFTPVSASIYDNTPIFNVYYRTRGYLTNGTTGVPITVTRADNGATTTLTTAAGGYTPYSDLLFAFSMNSSSVAVTNGGYNPYTFAAAASSTFAATSTSANIASQSQTVSFAYTVSLPPAPTGLATSSLGSTSVGLAWTDTASSTEQEDNFVLEYITGSDVSDFPGTTTTVAQDETSAIVSSLSGNTRYTFRLKTTNGAGDSVYVTTTGSIYTQAAAPTAFAGSASSQTSILLSWTDSVNASGAVYDVRYSDGTFITTTTDNTYTVSSLTQGTNYSFKIRTQNANDTSAYGSYSSTVTVKTIGAGSGTSPGAPASPSSAAPSTVEVTISFGESQIVSVGNIQHTVTPATPADDGSVAVTIESDPVTIVLYEGDEQLIDTDADGEDDLYVRLDSVSALQISMTLSSVDDLEFSINRALSETTDESVLLYMNSPSAVMFAINDSPDFSSVSYQPYSKTKQWTLASGNGEKTVYVKLRTAQGGEKILSDTITLIKQGFDVEDLDIEINTSGCELVPGKAYKAIFTAAVYYVGEAHNIDGTIDETKACAKRPFASANKYFTYFDSWDDVVVTTQTALDSVADDVLGFMPQGPHYDPKYGALVKVVTDPKVYLLLGGNKHWITSEAVFTALNYSWNWIEDVATSLLDKYTSAGEIIYTDHHPNYTLVKYENSPAVYRLEPNLADNTSQVKRWIPDEQTFESLNFRWDRIVTIDATEVYEIGDDLVILE